MKKSIIALLAILSTSAGAADCPADLKPLCDAADLKPLCDAAAGLKQHEGIYLQINPTKNVRFEQSGFGNFVSINDRGELAESYGVEGDAARAAVQTSADAVRRLASKRREPVVVLITREGKVFKGDEVRAAAATASTVTRK